MGLTFNTHRNHRITGKAGKGKEPPPHYRNYKTNNDTNSKKEHSDEPSIKPASKHSIQIADR